MCCASAGVDATVDLAEVVYASNFMHARSYLTDVGPWYEVGLAEQRAAEKPAAGLPEA